MIIESVVNRIKKLAIPYRLNMNLKGSKSTESSLLKFHSFKQDDEIESPSEALKLLRSGQVLVVKGALNKCSNSDLVNRALGFDIQEIEQLHQNKNLTEIQEIIQAQRGSISTLELQTRIIAHFSSSLGLERIFVELEPNLRLQPPFKQILKSVKEVESRIGTGQVSPHSVHKDSWYYHPKNTFNIWVSLTNCDFRNSLSILPESQDYYPPTNGFDVVDFRDALAEKHLELELEPGDAVIFLAELMHGSILNQSDITRGTLSMRFCQTEPVLHTDRHYHYVRFNSNKNKFRPSRLKKENFSPKLLEASQPVSPEGENIKINKKNIEISTHNGKITVPRYCPHQGVDMAGGFYCEKRDGWICPAHRYCVKGQVK
ncbi:phytanoyl-CoA dioxygenase family protein [Pseudomonadales bacterium]|nr:phytanoyl-CoA dioxygenase family protein [Pseudomonadales bacterium]